MNTNETISMVNNVLTIHENNAPIYKILIESDYKHLYKELEALGTANKRLCVVCDTNTSRYYLDSLLELLKYYAREVESFTFPAGEEYKTLDTVKNLYEQLILSRFDRGDILIALGGGVVGDLVGYTAATYLRGIQFIQMPTSLLSMVDSSIGGKTGVDFDSYKNMVGAFHQPKSVYINISCLKTLPEREYCSGVGEVIKYGLITDKVFYGWLKEHVDELLSFDVDSIQKMVYRSCYNKQLVVEEDPTEQGVRALLNLGHTIGHAVEKLMNFTLLHGECVAIGTVAAAYLSFLRGNITEVELLDIKATLQAFKLPTSVSGLDPLEVLSATKNDKKMLAGKIKFVLLQEIGHGIIDSTVSEEELLASIHYILN